MKKLMIAAAIVCAAFASQAATYTWSWLSKTTGSTGVLWDGTDSQNAYKSYGAINLYLIDSASVAQSDAFTALKNGAFKTTSSIASATLSNASKVPATTVNYGEKVGEGETIPTYTFYWVALMDDDPNTFYISSTIEKQALDSGSANLVWSDVNGNSKTTLDAAEGFKGAGVYQVSDVPEPTSAMLLLLGMAGLALKRKQK